MANDDELLKWRFLLLLFTRSRTLLPSHLGLLMFLIAINLKRDRESKLIAICRIILIEIFKSLENSQRSY